MIEVSYVVGQGLFRVPPSQFAIDLLDGSTGDVDGSTNLQALADKFHWLVFADYIGVCFSNKREIGLLKL